MPIRTVVTGLPTICAGNPPKQGDLLAVNGTIYLVEDEYNATCIYSKKKSEIGQPIEIQNLPPYFVNPEGLSVTLSVES